MIIDGGCHNTASKLATAQTPARCTGGIGYTRYLLSPGVEGPERSPGVVEID